MIQFAFVLAREHKAGVKHEMCRVNIELGGSGPKVLIFNRADQIHNG